MLRLLGFKTLKRFLSLYAMVNPWHYFCVEQGGTEGGEGSVTNRTEAKVHTVGVMGFQAILNGEYQPLSKKEQNPFEEFFK